MHKSARCMSCKRRVANLHRHLIDSPRHHYCAVCLYEFPDEGQLNQHFILFHEFCHSCEKGFCTEKELDEHYERSRAHYWCSDCRKEFESASNLRDHRNSSQHHDHEKDVVCPQCKGLFRSRSAVIIHWERERCVVGMNAQRVHDMVRAQDKNGAITNWDWYPVEYSCPEELCVFRCKYFSGLA